MFVLRLPVLEDKIKGAIFVSKAEKKPKHILISDLTWICSTGYYAENTFSDVNCTSLFSSQERRNKCPFHNNIKITL